MQRKSKTSRKQIANTLKFFILTERNNTSHEVRQLSNLIALSCTKIIYAILGIIMSQKHNLSEISCNQLK